MPNGTESVMRFPQDLHTATALCIFLPTREAPTSKPWHVTNRSKCVAFNADIGRAEFNVVPRMLTTILVSFPASLVSDLGSSSCTA